MCREQLGLLYVGVVGELQCRVIKALAVQPQSVFFRPSAVFFG
jgi:hypothetical protein